MAENNQDKPKIIIDDDWKSQAQQEKQRLSEEVEKKSQAAETGAAAAEATTGAAAGPAGADRQARRQLPPANFQTLVSTIATQAMMALGGMRDPKTNQPVLDLDLAKFHIDCLSVLEEKTAGNLEDEDKDMLNQVLYEIRMHYVQIAQQAG
jgi:hypothetical protein